MVKLGYHLITFCVLLGTEFISEVTFLFNIVVKACNYNFKHLVDHKNISSFMAQSLNQQLFDDHDEWNVRAQVALL